MLTMPVSYWWSADITGRFFRSGRRTGSLRYWSEDKRSYYWAQIVPIYRVVIVITTFLYTMIILFLTSLTGATTFTHVTANDVFMPVFFCVLGCCCYGSFEASDKNGEWRVFVSFGQSKR